MISLVDKAKKQEQKWKTQSRAWSGLVCCTKGKDWGMGCQILVNDGEEGLTWGQ